MNHKILALALTICVNSYAQLGNIPLNSWRYHTSHVNANVVVQAENKIYCGTEGGLFYFDKEDNTINKFSKIDGLNDLDISALYYHSPTKSLIIGYLNGNVDVVRDGVIYNAPFILKAGNITGSKKINSIAEYKNDVLLACDFGVVILNLTKLEIKESWLNIAENGSAIVAKDIISIGDSVFVASNKGLYRSVFDGKNLMDFKNWKKSDIVANQGNLAISKLSQSNQKLIVAINGFGVFKKDITWRKIYATTQSIEALKCDDQRIFIFSDQKLNRISNSDSSQISISEISQVKNIIFDKDNVEILWLSDNNNGLIKYDLINQSTNKYIPNGPLNNLVFNVETVNEYTFHFSGGYNGVSTPRLTSGNYSYFYRGEWIANKKPSETGLNDFTNVTLNTQNGNFYFASAWNGLIEKQNEDFIAYNYTSATCPIYDNFGTRVLDVYFDENTNTTWLANVAPSSSPSIQKFQNGICTGYNFPIFNSLFPAQILVDNAGNVWLRLLPVSLPGAGNDGIIVFNESNLDANNIPSYIHLRKGVGKGNLGENIVRCMAKDLNGDIWIGTNNGVSIVYSPGNVANGGIKDASTPIYENRPLLFDQVATCIAIDGGNRKWIGTNNGIYLFNAEGNKVIHYFNVENSPLLSNNLISVSINAISGEVFMGTDKGIVSYREPATLGNDEKPEVVIFPNPVKTNFTGTIGFTGLATDAIVKITDISGRLVYEIKANGGTAQWNGKDYNGRKIQTGVYVVLTSKSDGTSPAVGKIFVTD